MQFSAFAMIMTVFVAPLNALAQDTPSADEFQKLDQEFEQAVRSRHPEYGECLTHWKDACGAWNKDYVEPEPHGPSISDTVDWIGDQLKGHGLAHQFYHQGCTFALDMFPGSPAVLSWREEINGARQQGSRTMIAPDTAKNYDASGLARNGYRTYFSQGYRDNSSADDPTRARFYHDAAIIDLSTIFETKNYIGTNEDGSYYMTSAPQTQMFFRLKANSNYKAGNIGTDLPERQDLFKGAMPSIKLPDDSITIFDNTFYHFETHDQHGSFAIAFPLRRIDLNLRITRAFLHATSLCKVGQ